MQRLIIFVATFDSFEKLFQPVIVIAILQGAWLRDGTSRENVLDSHEIEAEKYVFGLVYRTPPIQYHRRLWQDFGVPAAKLFRVQSVVVS